MLKSLFLKENVVFRKYKVSLCPHKSQFTADLAAKKFLKSDNICRSSVRLKKYNCYWDTLYVSWFDTLRIMQVIWSKSNTNVCQLMTQTSSSLADLGKFFDLLPNTDDHYNMPHSSCGIS